MFYHWKLKKVFEFHRNHKYAGEGLVELKRIEAAKDTNCWGLDKFVTYLPEKAFFSTYQRNNFH